MHVPIDRRRSTARDMNHRRVTHRAIISLCFCIGLSLPAKADINEARRLANDGQIDQALAHVDEMLRSQPGDIAARLLRGVLLSSSGQSDAAIDTFLGVVEDRPDLPEPHNNLAVLYAAQGRYNEARGALIRAIKLQPDYDVAHENLGDVYLKLAFLAFSNAEQINPDNANAGNKAVATEQVLDASQSRRSIPPVAHHDVSATPQSAAPTTPVLPHVWPANVPPEPIQPARSSSRPQASMSNSPADSSVGHAYRVLLPAEQGAAQAHERIAQLRAKNVTDLIIIARGEHANGISLGVFAKRSGAQRRQAALADKDVYTQIVEHRTSAARDSAKVIALGPFDATEFTREFAQINYEISHDINDCR